MSTGDTSALDGLYDTSNPALLNFERERARFFSGGLRARWDGHIVSFASAVALLSIEKQPGLARLRVYERVDADWVPNEHPISADMRALMQRDPAKYTARDVRGPRGETTSSFGIPHEVTLLRGSKGWRIAADASDEFFLHGPSPDLVPGSWAAIWTGRRSNGLLEAPGATRSDSAGGHLASLGRRPLMYTYNYMAAVSYANNWCGASRNPDYCNYTGCGGDCANFVSQCFGYGGQPTDGTWYPTWGACPCNGGTAVKGSYAWINNVGLRNWVLTAPRGTQMGAIDQLGYGDIINYDFERDGLLDHVTIVTTPGNSSSARIASHVPDLCNYSWDLGWGSSINYTFTGMFLGG